MTRRPGVPRFFRVFFVPSHSLFPSLNMPGSMESRHKIRELALQVLFAFDAQARASDQLADEVTLGAVTDPSVVSEVRRIAVDAWEHRQAADEWATRLAPQWPTHRQPAVDRSVLRLAIWELTHLDTPPKVVIDEAIELAKQFSTANSPSFVNGVLDAVLKEVMELKDSGLRGPGSE
jgi:transcription antitermination protein NusB